MDRVKVSIIIPIYNVAPFIEDCLRSVLSQIYSSLEIILVNDATPDDSMLRAAPWIEKLQERFEVKVVNHVSNRGLSAARNTGIEVATGDWIYFLDSDDEIIPSCIELLSMRVNTHPGVDVVIGGIKTIGADWYYPLTCASYVEGSKNILRDYTNNKWYVMAVNRLYRKEYLLSNDLYFKDGLLHEDELYSFRIATTAQTMAVVYECTYIYKVRANDSITSQRKLKNFEDILYINKEKLTYMLKQYQANIHVIPYTYGLRIFYGYVRLLAKNNQIKKVDKFRLLQALKEAYQPLNRVLSLKYKLWTIVLKIPSRLILWSVKYLL